MFNELSNPDARHAAPRQPPGGFDGMVEQFRQRQLTPVRAAPMEPSPQAPSRAPSRAPSSVGAPPQAPSTIIPPAPGTFGDEPADDATKQGALLELQRLRQGGAILTREWGMHDLLEEMQMEIRKIGTNMEEAQMVNMMRDMMRLGFAGIEFLNGKVGLLELDGWAESMATEMQKYDPALRKLYHKWWRRTSSSPEMEIIIGLGTSLVMHHAKKKFENAAARRTARPPPSRRDTPFTMPKAATDSDGEEEAPPPVGEPVRVEFM